MCTTEGLQDSIDLHLRKHKTVHRLPPMITPKSTIRSVYEVLSNALPALVSSTVRFWPSVLGNRKSVRPTHSIGFVASWVDQISGSLSTVERSHVVSEALVLLERHQGGR